MSNVLLMVSAFLAMTSCGNEASVDSSKKKSDSKNKVENVEQDVAADVQYLTGVTDANNKEKEGDVHLTMKFTPNTTGSAYLYETEGKSYFLLDSAVINNGVADFGTKTYYTGFYMASVNKKESNMAAFIINPDEKDVEAHFASGRLEARLLSSNSKENQGWGEYYTEEKKFKKAIKDLKVQQYKSSIKTKFDPLIADKEQQLFDFQKSIIEKYPNTFLAKVVSYKHIPFKNDMGKFWSDIDFQDESLIRTTILNDRIQEFMQLHSGGSESGFINCIDLTKAFAEDNPRVLEFMLYSMLDGFYQSNMENICLYIYDNYIIDEDCGAELSDVIKTRAEGVMNLQVGKYPPNIVIPSAQAGGTIDLYDYAENNEYTLLMYWASWCHKCEQEMPVLINTYKQYKDIGFEIFGVSVDMNKNEWLKAVEDKGIIWPNGSELNQWNSKSAKDYRVTQTPTLFLLDKYKKIVLKPERIFEVNNFLKENLK